MAENIVASLFGLTPQMYGEQQRRSALQEGIDLAQLDPASRGAAMTYAGARGLGGAFANALGVEDPQLKLISARNSIFQQIDQSNPESMMQGIKMLSQMGDNQGAMALADYARKAQSEMALTQQRTAVATRERQQAVPKEIVIANEKARITDQLDQLRMQESTPEITRASRILTTQLAELEKLDDKSKRTAVVGNALVDTTTGEAIYKGPDAQKYSEFAKTLIDAGLTPGTDPFQKRMLEYATKKIEGVGKGTGNVTIGGINVDTGAAAKAAGKIVGENVANIETQFSLKTAFDDAIKLVNQGIYGGAYGPEKQFLAKFTGIGSPQKVENTEVFMANIGEIVIPRLQQFGGNDSNEELKYLQRVVAGELRMEPKAMLRVLESAERKTRNNLERLQKQASGKPGEAMPTTPMNAPLGSPQNPIKLRDK
jgi:chaperonin cofactor prefoldin